MAATVETTQRQTRATRMEPPVVENLEREPQMADEHGHLENIALDQRANFPHIGYTECLIRAVRLDGDKYGKDKEKLFPSAARLQAVRMLLESTRDGTKLDQPAGVDSNKWNSFTSDTPKAYALDAETGDLLRLGIKSGYAVPREKIHKVLTWAHEVTEHAGRDKLYRFLGQYYSVDCFPKEFVECWLAACPGHKHRAGKEPQAIPGPKASLKKRVQALWKQEGHLHEASSGPDHLVMGLANEDPITRALLGFPEPPMEPAVETEQAPVQQQAEGPAVQTVPENIVPDDAQRAIWNEEWDVLMGRRAPADQVQDVPVAYPLQTLDNLLQPVQQFNAAGPSTAGDWQQYAPAYNFPVPTPLANWQPPTPGFNFTQPAPIPNWEQPPPEPIIDPMNFEAIDFEAMDFDAVDFEAMDFGAMDFDWETGDVVVGMPAPVQVPTMPGPAP